MLQTTEETELTMPSDFRWHFFLVSAGYLPDTYYPVNDEKNAKLYDAYKCLADKESKVIFGCIFRSIGNLIPLETG